MPASAFSLMPQVRVRSLGATWALLYLEGTYPAGSDV